MTAPRTGVLALLGRALGSWLVFALAPIVAIRLRWAHLEALKKTPIFNHLIGDSVRYDQWAQQLAGGDWLWGTAAFYQDPLYPYFLGALYKLFGHDTALVRTVQVGLSAATCILVGLIARRLAGPAAGSAAALAWAFFRPDIFNVGELDKTILTGFLVAGGLLAMLSERRGWRALAGLLFGLAALARGNLLIVAPVVAGLYAWPDRAQWRRLHRTHGGTSALLFLAAFALALLPPTLRNYEVAGLPVLTTGLGPNFFIGNSEWSNTGFYELMPFVRPEAVYEETDFHNEAERRTGRAMDAREVSQFWLGEALDFIAQHPGLTAQRFLRRSWLVANDHEATDMIDLETVARYSPVLRLPLFSVGWFMPLALLGLWTARKRSDIRLLGAWTLAMWVGLAAFFILARYRMALLPAVVPLATVGAAQLLAWVQERDWKRSGIAAVAVAALTAGLFVEPHLARVLHGLSPLNVAVIFSNVGQYAEAEALMRYGAQQAPEQPAAWCALGNHYAAFKRWNEARDAVTKCLAADQRHRGAYLLLGRVEEVAGNIEAARAAYQRQLQLIPGEQEAAMRLQALPEPAPTPTTPAPAQ